MKKMKHVLLLGSLVLPTLVLGTIIGTEANDKPFIKAKADVVEKYIPFNAANFTVSNNPIGFDDADDWVTGRFGTFWNHRHFNALDNFYDGFRNEGWTGTITSKTWVQDTDFLTFTLGGNPMDGATIANKVVVKQGTTTIAEAHNSAFIDPTISLNMVVKVVSIPSEYIGQTLHLEIVDGKTGGFGGITFGALKVNQTEEEVARTIETHKISLSRIDTSANPAEQNTLARTATLSEYDTNSSYDYYVDTLEVLNVDESFEVNALTNWGYDVDYSEISSEDANPYFGLNFGGAISADQTFWAENVPYNQEGSFHYNGWAAASSEVAKYRLISAPMKVTGSGYMSVKMGGRTAELQILNKDTLATLATFRNPSFNDVPGIANIVSSGTRLATMTRVVVDATEYLNQEVVIALADAETGGGWGVAFFDELITYYATAPSFQLDPLSHAGENGVIRDMYLGPDGSAMKDAYTFLNSYFTTLRSGTNDYTYCDLLDSNPSAVSSIIGQYDALSTAAKTIVDSSEDYSYGLVAGDENFLHNTVDFTNVGTTINFIKLNVGPGGPGLRNLPTVMDYNRFAILGLILGVTLISFFVYFKKIRKA